MVANPRAVRRFAQALMKRSKNDLIDADVLVEFAQRMPFQRWVRPSAAVMLGAQDFYYAVVEPRRGLTVQ